MNEAKTRKAKRQTFNYRLETSNLKPQTSNLKLQTSNRANPMHQYLLLAGIIQVLLALIHFIFPKYFKWKEDLSPLTLVNRQLMYVHTFFIALVVLLMGIICLLAPDEIISTKLGKILSAGLFIFWATRLVFQFFGYSSQLWRGKTFETVVHIIFSIIWIYLTAVFLIVFNLPR